jgi:hypothetical protein
MIRVWMFDSIDGTNPLYCVDYDGHIDSAHAIAISYKELRFALQTLFHLSTNKKIRNVQISTTVFDANNNVFQTETISLLDWIERSET